ncbi:hypothetical protein FB468_0479 [Leucobacter komagatae]|uniref:Fe-S oxidoreductase n=1 Tax=Leucobacter komagatae TaxID=55969 RepID=A0A542Y337_9MICO|nr:Fe-S oxidoreductase [Leucobacter komagatae]TQL42486.1 hypothetical protein FB468_0479 [Leucobacter komagatae]
MQLGSRWQAGQPPHHGVPELLHAAISAAESGVFGGNEPAGSWTLTWLEGRPRVELVDGAGVLRADIGVDAAGRVTERAIGGTAPDGAGAGHANGADANDADADDDDWLS